MTDPTRPSPGPLPRPATTAGAEGLAALLAEPGKAVVGLDFDGTLAPIVGDPDQAYAHPDAVPTLRRLVPLLDSVAVITGRPADVAVRLLGGELPTGVVVLGHYGFDRWEDGELRSPPPHPGVARAREAIVDLLRTLGAPEGTWVEDKGAAVAVHTRRTASPQVVLDALRDPIGVLAEDCGLVMEPGRFVLELRPPGVDKGVTLTGYVSERGARSVLYAGDDLGDLPAFSAVEQMRAEDGLPGVKVCSGSAEVSALAAEADVIVDGPAGVVGLLAALAEVIEG